MDQEILEIGCATGYMTRALVECSRCRVTGFEINPRVASAVQPYLQKLIIGDLEKPADVARIQEQFDVILIADVLEHVAWPEVPLRILRHHLAPSGRLILSLPNVAHWTVRQALLLGKWDLTERGIMDRTHLRWYTRKTAQVLIESCGFRLITRRASYVFPAHWHAGWGQKSAAWAQCHRMPRFLDDLFAVQHIFVAEPGPRVGV